ncbi:MAG TPA: S-layer homology domain-containing protein [Syntrophomonas sp.]|nr:S-layer homology domain-containing protein [Syntrophomonas sp.]
MPDVTAAMLQADYWIDKIADPDRVILNPVQIEEFNREIVKKLPGVDYDLTVYPPSLTRAQLISLVAVPFPTETSYVEDKPVEPAYWQTIKTQMNLSAIRDDNPVKHGLTVRRSNLRVYPTADVIGDEIGDPGYDLVQNSSVLAAEPVVILHQSRDRQWYFVQIYNCAGWVPAADVAVCDRNDWIAYQNEPDFIVVTGNRVKLDSDPLLPQISELEFTMGTRLPLVKAEEVPDSIRGRRVYQNYVVKLPVRDTYGQAEFVLVPVPVSAEVSLGYMPYTRANIIRQALKTQGERYGWGGMLNVRDCSALVMEIYRCFGFMLPRNTSGQEASAGKTQTFKDYSVAYRESLLSRISPGATLFFNGHEMLYLGEDAGHYYVLSDLGSFGEVGPDGEIQGVRVRTVVINDLNIHRGSGRRWIENLTTAKLLEKTSFTDLAGRSDQALIENLADHYILQGVGDNTFDPEGNVSRAEFVVMLDRVLGLEPEQAVASSGDQIGPELRFADVSQQWYAGYVETAIKAGLIKGGDSRYFHPEAALSRAEAAVMLARVPAVAAAAGEGGSLQSFSDGNAVPVWAEPALTAVMQAGIMPSRETDRLAPLAPVTRAEAAAMLDVLLNLIQMQKS